MTATRSFSQNDEGDSTGWLVDSLNGCFYMKRIVLCFDGTWNRPADEALPAAEQIETNVSRFYKAVSDTGSNAIRQVKWYDEGVGTHWFDRFLGGGLGAGLEFNIIEGYKFLASQYEDGDEVYVLGFSRGAYTARSLVGMIRNCGLIDKGLVGLKVGIPSSTPGTTARSVERNSVARLLTTSYRKGVAMIWVIVPGTSVSPAESPGQGSMAKDPSRE